MRLIIDANNIIIKENENASMLSLSTSKSGGPEEGRGRAFTEKK